MKTLRKIFNWISHAYVEGLTGELCLRCSCPNLEAKVRKDQRELRKRLSELKGGKG